MRYDRIEWLLAIALTGLTLFMNRSAEASNGMNMIGYGAESIAMGGADLALTNSPSAMNINPAGIGRASRPEVAFALGSMDPSLEHTDRLGNEAEDVLDRYPVPFVGYVHPLGDLTVGVGLFVQGGMGAEYQGLVTPFSARASSGSLPPQFWGSSVVPPTDATLTNLAHAKLTPALAWRVLPRLTLGASLNVSYVTADMQLFPETSVMADLDGSGTPGDSPRDVFFGLDGEDVSDVGFGLRLGAQYDIGALAIGGSYSTETDFELDGGTMTMNLSALGLGKVRYDCTMLGLTWPQQAGLGFAYRVGPHVLLAADVDWIDWSGAISTITIRVVNPDAPQAPRAREIPLQMGWDDQWVGAVGMELTHWRNWALRLGYNYGDSPIPDAMLRPLFPAIAEDHVTAGVGFRWGNWIFDLGFEHALDTEKTNDSSDPTVNPFGTGSRESLSQFTGHFMVRRGFPRDRRAPAPMAPGG